MESDAGISAIGDLAELQEDAGKLGESGFGISAAITFIHALEPGTFTKKSHRYVYDPNFLTLSFHTVRGHHVAVTLRGEVSEFEYYDHLPLKRARGDSYSECIYDSILQLDALLLYIRRAHSLWREGRNRVRMKREIRATPVKPPGLL